MRLYTTEDTYECKGNGVAKRGNSRGMIPQIYLAGPFTGPSAKAVFDHCYVAIHTAQTVVELGAYPVTSHAIGLYCQDGCGQGPDWWYDATLAQMLRCDAVLMLDGWQGSTGAIKEREVALAANMPVFAMVRELRTWVKGFGE